MGKCVHHVTFDVLLQLQKLDALSQRLRQTFQGNSPALSPFPHSFHEANDHNHIVLVPGDRTNSPCAEDHKIRCPSSDKTEASPVRSTTHATCVVHEHVTPYLDLLWFRTYLLNCPFPEGLGRLPTAEIQRLLIQFARNRTDLES